MRLLLLALFWAGLLMVLVAGMLANHLELIGLRKVLDSASGRQPGTADADDLRTLQACPTSNLCRSYYCLRDADITAGHLLF